MTTAILLIQGGVEPLYVIAAVNVVAALSIMLLERCHPYDPTWNVSQGDVGNDFLHLLVSMVGVPQLFNLVALASLYAVAETLSTSIGSSVWPTSWPIVAQVGLAMVIGEFAGYWGHRLQHEVPWLWRLHATHHSSGRLYWLNAARFHPLDTLFTYAFHTAILVFVGCPSDVFAMTVVFIGVHGMFQHANIEMRLGPLNWIFSMAELHRWHHSKTLKEANANYGSDLILWDVIFGTRFLPSDRKPPREIGIADLPNFPTDYIGQVLSPFRWRAIEGTVASDAREPDGPSASRVVQESQSGDSSR